MEELLSKLSLKSLFTIQNHGFLSYTANTRSKPTPKNQQKTHILSPLTTYIEEQNL